MKYMLLMYADESKAWRPIGRNQIKLNEAEFMTLFKAFFAEINRKFS